MNKLEIDRLVSAIFFFYGIVLLSAIALIGLHLLGLIYLSYPVQAILVGVILTPCACFRRVYASAFPAKEPINDLKK